MQDQRELLEWLGKQKIILASQSPRRREIFHYLELPFEVIPANLDESSIRGENPMQTVELLALAKAETVGRDHPEALVVAADTGVILGDQLFEKPASREEAYSMLSNLSGKRHEVFTGVGVLLPNSSEKLSFTEISGVYFSELSGRDIEDYIDTGLPFDKAGSYGIQEAFGARYIEKIEGDFFNIMGFPLNAFLRRLLKTVTI